jgi:hypothetical protein
MGDGFTNYPRGPMQRRDRLMNTLRGQPVDRPAVSFYEINGLDERADDPDPFNIYSHPSWAPLIELAREKTDRIVMRSVRLHDAPADPAGRLSGNPLAEMTTEMWNEDDTCYARRTIRHGRHVFTAVDRRDPDVNTTWRIEHFLKGPDDLRAWLALPEAPQVSGEPDTSGVLAAEAALGDSGIVMLDTADPICIAADLFSMGDYTVAAATEPALFHRLLERYARTFWPKTERRSPRRCRGGCGASTGRSMHLCPISTRVSSGSTSSATTRRWCRPFSATAVLRGCIATAVSRRS